MDRPARPGLAEAVAVHAVGEARHGQVDAERPLDRAAGGDDVIDDGGGAAEHVPGP